MRISKAHSTLVLGCGLMMVLTVGCKRDANVVVTNTSTRTIKMSTPEASPPAINTQAPTPASSPKSPDSFMNEIQISGDESGTPEKTVFKTNEKIYVVVRFLGIPEAEGLKFRLVADEVEGVEAGESLDGEVYKTDKGDGGVVPFTLTPGPDGWKRGTYHVELNLITEDGESRTLKTRDLTIQ
jgi:hypothetical protein